MSGSNDESVRSFVWPNRSDLWKIRKSVNWETEKWKMRDVTTLYYVRSNKLHRRSTKAWKRLRSNAMAATEFRSSRVRLYISIKSVPAQSACGRPRLRRARRKVKDLGRGGYKEFGLKRTFRRGSFSGLRRICPNQRMFGRPTAWRNGTAQISLGFQLYRTNFIRITVVPHKFH